MNYCWRFCLGLLLEQALLRDSFGVRFVPIFHPSPRRVKVHIRNALSSRGGGGGDAVGETEDDEERYSRQVFALGAEAHKRIRSSTVYLDGPGRSGLLYECAKNLALSGVRKLVLVKSSEKVDAAYFKGELDDLGRAYHRAARSETGKSDDDCDVSDEEVLMEYLKRLNPSVKVSVVKYSDFRPLDDSLRGVLLCVDRCHEKLLVMNGLARRHNLAFVGTETAGVYGRVFCDFGTSFEVNDTDGETPLVIPLDRVERGISDEILFVTCLEGEQHDVSKGEEIRFIDPNGDSSEQKCTVIEVHTPLRLSIEVDKKGGSCQEWIESVNKKYVAFSRIKASKKLSFDDLAIASKKASSDASIFTPSDLGKSFDDNRRAALFACFRAASSFVGDHLRWADDNDLDDFCELVRTFMSNCESEHCFLSESQHFNVEQFLEVGRAKFSPIQAFFGAIASQEALKALTGLYHPIQQFLLYDCDEILNSPSDRTCSVNEKEGSDRNTCGLRHILGDSIVEDLQSMRVFVVGAGAIGCEILKNLAAMGIGSKSKGRVIITDMDTIEKSNLSRQLLFRDSDVGKFKSSAATQAILRFNNKMKIDSHSSKVGDSEHNPFDDLFWRKGVDIVLNALDNMEARFFTDRQCVANGKPLIDSGTLGPKGNVQVVIPHKSESYSSSADPPDPAIAVCTLKNFPYAISHTIQWGRDLFEDVFSRRPSQVNDARDSLSSTCVEAFVSRLIQERGENGFQQFAAELKEDVSPDLESSDIRAHSLEWAASTAVKLFRDSIETLLLKHPPGSLDDDGEPFWSGTRRQPRVLSFSGSVPLDAMQSSVNENLIDFVRYAARLRAEMYASKPIRDPFEFSRNDAEASLNSAEQAQPSDKEVMDTDTVNVLIDCLRRLSSFSKPLNTAEFEKDDDSNGHIAFVTAASNLRAMSYGIPPVNRLQTRRIAGNIVPAVISTTAAVSALSCIELVKLAQGAQLKLHRNAFMNLALPFFAFTSPLPAEVMPGLQGRQYTIWDRLKVRESKKALAKGGISLRKLIRRIKQLASTNPKKVSVLSISFGPYLLYASFLHDDDKNHLKSSLWNILEELTEVDDDFVSTRSNDNRSTEYSPTQKFVDLSVIVEDPDNGSECELPLVRVFRRFL
jgi:ubiquitin-activating enzyme E1